MNRPPLRYRLRYLWPPNDRALVERLRASVLAGALFATQAHEIYIRESRVVTNPILRALLLLDFITPLYPLISFVMAESVRNVLRRPHPFLSRDHD